MPKAKTIKWCLLAAWIGCNSSMAQGEPVLGKVIDQTKQLKQRQLAPTSAQSVAEDAPPPPPPPPPALWSIFGINDQLVAEIWQGDMVYRLPLEKGAKLPTGWQVVEFDMQSVTLKQGKARRKLMAATRGSTGWEYPQTPRSVGAGGSGSAPPINSPSARTAASNLPPAAMPSVGFSSTPASSRSR